MRSGWAKEKLGDVCQMINRGISPKYIEEDGLCVVNQKCVRDHEVDYARARRHDLNSKGVNKDRYIQVGDVLVNSTGTGTLGRVAQVREEPPEPTTVDTHVTIVRPKHGKFFTDFFGYMLIKIEDEIASSGEGASGQTELARSTLENKFYVSYPHSIAEQKQIVAILDEAFEGIASATANAEKNLANARELFERYLNSAFTEKGDGWVQSTLAEVCSEKITDGTHQTPKYFDSGYIFLSSKNVTSRRIDWDNIKYIDELQHQEMHRRIAPKIGDILLAKNGTTGVAAVVDRDVIFDIYVSLAWLRPSEKITSRFMWYFLNSPVAKKQFNKRIKGVGVPNLHLQEIREVIINYPSTRNQQEKVVQRLDNIFEKLENLEQSYSQKISALADLKKSLLQKAFSGELTAEKAKAAKKEAVA